MLKKTNGGAPVLSEFLASDAVNFVPKTGSVIDVASDKTVDALLSGAFGPCVVVFVAEWCVHCKNMNDAFETAAKSARVPFVRVQGPKVPVSGQKYAVAGYPTIFGIANVGGPPRRYASLRTVEGLGEFASGLAPLALAAAVAAPAAPAAPAVPVVPSQAPSQPLTAAAPVVVPVTVPVPYVVPSEPTVVLPEILTAEHLP
jgi:thiol-disulfide isomerase/thioredoxin